MKVATSTPGEDAQVKVETIAQMGDDIDQNIQKDVSIDEPEAMEFGSV